MKLNVIGDPSVIERNEVNKEAKGGTELMQQGLADRLDKDLLKNFQLIASRYRGTDDKKIPIYWCHDLAQDPEMQHLKDGGWDKFEKIVAVSHWQKQQIIDFLGVPPSKIVVMPNAIVPVESHVKPDSTECINLIYHTTPHRGLELLYPIMEWVENNFPDKKWHLDVYSSFKIYGSDWSNRDDRYKELFKKIEDHPNMTYHGTVSNDEVKEALKKAHIFCLPSIWPETSCIAMLEAMSAGCLIVTSSLAALPETCANWALMYDFSEDMQDHASRCALTLADAIQLLEDPAIAQRLQIQREYINGFYNWDVRAKQWTVLLNSILDNKNG